MPNPRFPKIDVQELRDDFIRFELTETDASVANAIRRVMIAEVPTLAIDLVSIEVNTSVMTDEFLAHRLGMIPLNFDGGLENFRQRFVYSQDCDCDENCPNCSVEFTLDVVADQGVLTVTSEALKSSDPYIRPVNFSSEEELNNTQDTGVIIAKLGPGQRIKLSAIAKLVRLLLNSWLQVCLVVSCANYRVDSTGNRQGARQVVARGRRDLHVRADHHAQPGRAEHIYARAEGRAVQELPHGGLRDG